LNGSVDDLRQDLLAVARDAESLLEATADAASEKVQQARGRAAASLNQVRSTLGSPRLRRQVTRAARQTDDYVRDHRWGLLGAVAGIALLLGVVLNRD
jgi:ElaB/YqjD/DUF883 family membrane-anchored ribosome-binding protein